MWCYLFHAVDSQRFDDCGCLVSQFHNVFKYAINTYYNLTLWCWHDTSLVKKKDAHDNSFTVTYTPELIPRPVNNTLHPDFPSCPSETLYSTLPSITTSYKKTWDLHIWPPYTPLRISIKMYTLLHHPTVYWTFCDKIWTLIVHHHSNKEILIFWRLEWNALL